MIGSVDRHSLEDCVCCILGNIVVCLVMSYLPHYDVEVLRTVCTLGSHRHSLLADICLNLVRLSF